MVDSRFILAATGVLILVARVVPGVEALLGFLDVDVVTENTPKLMKLYVVITSSLNLHFSSSSAVQLQCE